MKKICTLFLLCLLSLSAFSQIKAKAVLYSPAEFSNDKFRVSITNAVAEQEFSKFKVQIQNKTENFLVYYAGESIFKADAGEYKHNRDTKFIFVKPYETSSRTVEVQGTIDWRKDAYSFLMKGLYEVSAEGIPYTANDFKLPATEVSFNAGPFSVKMINVDQKTDETVVKFSCIYNGDKIGIVDPVKVVVKTPNGKEFAVYNINVKPNLLEKGGEDKFTLAYKVQPNIGGGDMQKSDLYLIWKNCFRESDKKSLDVPPFELKMNGTK